MYAGLQNTQRLPAGPARNNYKIIKWALVSAAVLFMCLLGLISLTPLFSVYGVTLLVGIVLAILPLPLYIALALWIDRYEKEPAWMLGLTFLWGATVAIFISGIINALSGAIVGEVLNNPTAGQLFSLAVSAPIAEESTKGLALLILFFWKKDEFDNVLDGIVYAAMVGLGFAVVENVDYYARAAVEGGVSGSLESFVVRGVLDPFGHPVDTAMTGIGLGLARQSSKSYVKFLAPVAGLMVAIMLHSIFNLSSIFIGFGVVLIDSTLLIGVLVVVFFALRREGRIVRQHLMPELQSGLLTQQEYNALDSVFGRIGSSFRALSGGGFGGWLARRRFNQTASELAFHRDRVARGVVPWDQTAARREAAYVELLRQLRPSVSGAG